MAEPSANPTDTAIGRHLTVGPLPTTALAARLGVPERTVRHRLYRLRQGGTVVTGLDGRHRLAAPALPAPAEPAPATLAAPVLPARAVPGVAPENPASDGSFPRHGGHPRARAVLAAAALGLAVAGGIAVTARIRRMPPPPPTPPTQFGDAGDPWGWTRGPTW